MIKPNLEGDYMTDKIILVLFIILYLTREEKENRGWAAGEECGSD
jgi:hypothetical protein